jgi:hypothetical protein
MKTNVDLQISSDDPHGTISAQQPLPPEQHPACQFNSPAEAGTELIASREDLLVLLAQMATPNRRQSAHRRRDAETAREALAGIFGISSAARPRTVLEGWTGTETSAGEPRRPAMVKQSKPERTVSKVGSAARKSHSTFRKYCTCGTCKWCIDNSRWDRVFEEKFADPNYYGTLRIRYNSCLGGAV